MAACTNGVTCDTGTGSDGTALNDDKDTITIETTITGQDGMPTQDGLAITVTGIRVDVSSLDVGDEIIATISTSAPSGLIPVGQSRRGAVSCSGGRGRGRSWPLKSTQPAGSFATWMPWRWIRVMRMVMTT